jgi:hypothetical protein
MNFWHFFASDVLSKTRPITLGHQGAEIAHIDNNLDPVFVDKGYSDAPIGLSSNPS